MGDDEALWRLMQAIAANEEVTAFELLAAAPSLAQARLQQGAARATAADYFLNDIQHYAYAGDTALHIAAAGYRLEIVKALIAAGADVKASNRRGAEPLHYAADGGPGAPSWNPQAQAATIATLIQAGADPNALDRSGVAPLHRAVRTRCAGAVSALLDGGADAVLRNGAGSTPMQLATQPTGRGGSSSPEAKAQQAQIVRLLERHGAAA